MHTDHVLDCIQKWTPASGHKTKFSKIYKKNCLTDDWFLLICCFRLFRRLFRFSHGVKGRWEDVITPLPLLDVSFRPAFTVVGDLAGCSARFAWNCCHSKLVTTYYAFLLFVGVIGNAGNIQLLLMHTLIIFVVTCAYKASKTVIC